MKDALKNIGADLAEQIVAKFQAPEVQKLLADTKAASDSESGTFEVVITTENLDRYQEVIKLDGWDLAHYRNNPIVLWGHDHNQPIGMATSVDIIDGKMIAKGKFAPTEKAQEVRRLYDFGIIKATSVGFIEKEREGNLITKAELLEFSFVSVPANPYALSLSMEKGLSVNELVTKGLMFVEKTGEEEATLPESEDEAVTEAETTEEVVVVDEPVIEEKSFSTKQLSPVIDSLRSVILTLEALGITAVEPEGDDDDQAAGDEEADKIKGYLALKSTFQSLDTTLGEVLADLRKAGSAAK